MTTKPSKTLNVDEDLHREVKLAATMENYGLREFVQALLRVGLSRPKDVRRLLADSTTPAPGQEPKQ